MDKDEVALVYFHEISLSSWCIVFPSCIGFSLGGHVSLSSKCILNSYLVRCCPISDLFGKLELILGES